MNEKLLTLYYHILVVLLFGDAIVGVIWLFRYNYLVTNLRSDLKSKLNNDYGYDASFQVRKNPEPYQVDTLLSTLSVLPTLTPPPICSFLHCVLSTTS